MLNVAAETLNITIICFYSRLAEFSVCFFTTCGADDVTTSTDWLPCGHSVQGRQFIKLIGGQELDRKRGKWTGLTHSLWGGKLRTVAVMSYSLSESFSVKTWPIIKLNLCTPVSYRCKGSLQGWGLIKDDCSVLQKRRPHRPGVLVLLQCAASCWVVSVY